MPVPQTYLSAVTESKFGYFPPLLVGKKLMGREVSWNMVDFPQCGAAAVSVPVNRPERTRAAPPPPWKNNQPCLTRALSAGSHEQVVVEKTGEIDAHAQTHAKLFLCNPN